MSQKTTITPVIGTPRNDSLSGTNRSEILSGRQGDDTVNGRFGSDIGYGGSGDDKLQGGSGNDVLYGGGGPSYADMSTFEIAADYAGQVTFLDEGAGYRNTLGMYKVDDAGGIENVEILFANSSARGSGGDLERGESSVPVTLEAGDKVGFFVLPNGYSRNGETLETGEYVIRDTSGGPATMDTEGLTQLYRTDPDSGAETLVFTQFGTAFFHSAADPDNGYALNPDAYPHTVGHIDAATGEVVLGFEDIYNGGDNDYDDVVLSFDVGRSNAEVLDPNIDTTTDSDDAPKWIYDATGNRVDQAGNVLASENDALLGGDGDDQLYGMAGHDNLAGGDGADSLKGNSGDDELFGNAGFDRLSGGKNNDRLSGGTGDDTLDGNSGDDTLFGNDGDDDLTGSSGDDDLDGGSGQDTLDGGSGQDVLSGDIGNDFLEGGSGDDTLSGGTGSDTLEGGKGADVLQGGDGGDKLKSGSGDDVLDGGAGEDYLNGWKGDDTLDGGAGDDRLYLGAGDDIATGGSGSDRFVFRSVDLDGGSDIITDFTRAGVEQDQLDLRQLDPLSNGMSADEWVAAHVQAGADGTVTMDLSDTSLIFTARAEDDVDALFADVVDGLMFI